MWQPFIIFTTRLWQAPGLQTWPAQIVCFDTPGLCGFSVPHAGCARAFRPRLSSQGVLEVMSETGQLVQLIAGPVSILWVAALIPRGKPADICRMNPLWAPATPWWLSYCCSHPATRVCPRDWFRHKIQRRTFSYTAVKKFLWRLQIKWEMPVSCKKAEYSTISSVWLALCLKYAFIQNMHRQKYHFDIVNSYPNFLN